MNESVYCPGITYCSQSKPPPIRFDQKAALSVLDLTTGLDNDWCSDQLISDLSLGVSSTDTSMTLSSTDMTLRNTKWRRWGDLSQPNEHYQIST
jgi:hypothetical protein